MLEIIGLILLCNVNKKNAVAAGKSGGGAIGMTIGLWIGLEMVGAFIGGAADLGMGSYILALVFGAVGGIASYAIAKTPSKKPGIQNSTGQYGPAQTYIPQPQGFAGAFPQAGNPQSRFCIRCGHQLAAGVKFCPYCGMAVNPGAQPNPVRVAPAAQPVPFPAAPVHPAPVPDKPYEGQPIQPPKVKKQSNLFYAFAVQGPAFGMAGGGDIVKEKAQKLREDYGPAKDMELKIVRPGMWNASVQNNSTGGVISVSYSFNAFKDEIRKYLLKENIPAGAIENGIKLCDDNSPQLSNPMSGVFVMGIPIVLESRPDAEAQTPRPAEPVPPSAPTPCTHDYKHFTCVICGEKAPKPQLASEGIRKQNQHTYEDYTAKSAEEARYFLEQTSVAAPLYYVMVHTPEGDWGRDKDGIFLSQLCDFQRDLSLRQCDAKTALFPERMPDMQMAANKVTDNYMLSVTCGECGYGWIDGVGYRTKTIVRCPDCGRYNLADTEHIRFSDL